MNSNKQALVDQWSEAKAKQKAANANVVEAQNALIAVFGVGEFSAEGVSIKEIPASEGKEITLEDVGDIRGARKAHFRVSLIHKGDSNV